MKLILEHWDGQFFCYKETEKRFRNCQFERLSRGKRLPQHVVEDDCNVFNGRSMGSKNNWHVVFSLKK